MFGKYATYFRELQIKGEPAITDEDYAPFEAKVGSVIRHSPNTVEELGNRCDENLLAFINEWELEHVDFNNGFVETTIEALAESFQTAFTESIIPNQERRTFWIHNAERIERPIYVRSMINAMRERIRTKSFDMLDVWLTFCEWVLSHPDEEYDTSQRSPDASRQNPNWSDCRRAVGDFVGACLEVNVPMTAREQLRRLLDMLARQFDWRLDRSRPVILGHPSQLDEAINNTRSRALWDVVKFSIWLRSNDQTAEVSEVTAILEKRFAPDSEFPLTGPEQAILGMNYSHILALDKTWAIEHKSEFFPQNDLSRFGEPFGNFLRFGSVDKVTFEILKDEFKLAVQHRAEIGGPEISRILGQQVFLGNFWDLYPLRGNQSILQMYYQSADDDRGLWTNLFRYVGHRLQDNWRHLDDESLTKVVLFFEWRLEVGNVAELGEFSSWLGAECLSAEWRLHSYSKILDLGQPMDEQIIGQLGALQNMLTGYTAEVVRCFAKITDRLTPNTIYIQTYKAGPILKAGLAHDDDAVRSDAKRAQENLLGLGRSDFLDFKE